jgi:hypothetical protein
MNRPFKLPLHLSIVAFLAAAALAPVSIAWDAAGHAMITLLALDRFKAAKGTPAWINETPTRDMIAWQSGEPDRWRGTRTPTLKHENDPDHYLDLEDLSPYGLTLRTVPMLRNEFIKTMALARAAAPDKFPPINPAIDTAKTLEYPGFLPQAIMEHHDKLRSAMNTLRILEGLADAASDRRKLQIEQTKNNIRVEMGLLSHFVGDAAQPLHTTTHHHGWVGDNPKGYTTERSIHSYIDGTILTIHKLTHESLQSRNTTKDQAQPAIEPANAPPAEIPPRVTNTENPWNDVLTHIERSFAKVEPLYEMKKTGELEKDAGKAMIAERLTDAGAMLGDLYAAAWASSEPTAKQIEDYLKYEAKP